MEENKITNEDLVREYQETGDLDVLEELLKRNMENAMKLSVRLTCDMNSADNWYDLK